MDEHSKAQPFIAGLTDDQLQHLIEDPPPGWYRLTVRLERPDQDKWHEVKTLISEGELRERDLEGLTLTHAGPAFTALKAALL